MRKKKLSPLEEMSRELEQWIKKLKCSGTTGLTIESFQDIKIGVDKSPVNRQSKSLEVYPSSEIDEMEDQLIKEGPLNNSKLDGRGKLIFPNGDTISGEFNEGQRFGYCEVILRESRNNIIAIRGNYKDDLIDGKAKIYFKDRCWLDGYFKYGVQHGFARMFDKKGRLKFVGNFRNGAAVGVCWTIVRGGGCIVGRVNSEGEHTGCRIAYLYPDFMTVLVGTFQKGVLQRAQETKIESIVEEESGIKIPVFSRPSGHVHVREIGDYSKICSEECNSEQTISQFPGPDPLIPDPYESKFLEVKKSKISGANEGLFAKQDIEPNTVIAFYNGSRANPADFDPSTWETNNYRIFDPADIPNGTIDIPIWAQETSAYCSSLAHKCNHSFTPNSEFVVFDHPKFGLIPCLTSTADIFKGEEVFVGYGYDLNDSPEWYKEGWKNSVFAKQGVSYKDWLDCNVKRPIGLRERRHDA